MATQGLERIPDSLGYLVLTEDGAVVSVSYKRLSAVIFQPVLHDRSNKGHGMCYPVCGMAPIKDPLLLIRKNSPLSGGSEFPLSLWLFPYHFLMPCNHKWNVLSASLNKTFPSFLLNPRPPYDIFSLGLELPHLMVGHCILWIISWILC